MRIPNLPNWCLTDKNPAFYDTESASTIKQTAKLYKAIRELQEDYNLFSSEINTKIKEFMTSEEGAREDFENEINKLVHDYIVTLDSKIAHQDRVIEESIVYIKNNLETALTKFVSDLKQSGELDIVLSNAFDNLGTRVIAIENSLPALIDRVTANETDIDTLESRTTSIEERTTNNENSISTLNSSVGLLEENQANYINKTNDNTTTINFEEKGTAIVVRRGNVVTIRASMSLSVGESKSLSNKTNLPEWAYPSSVITQTNLKSTTGTNSDNSAYGYLVISIEYDYIAFVGNNLNEVDEKTIDITFTYVVD